MGVSLRILIVALTLAVETANAQGIFGRRRSKPSPSPSPSPYERRRSHPTPSPSPSPHPPPPLDLHTEIQQRLDEAISHFSKYWPNLVLSVAYRDASLNVAAASGTVSSLDRAVTPKDTFLYGSGTKPFTATAILRLIDAGKLQSSDKVSDIVDPYLKRQGKPLLAEYFGGAVTTATVLELIQMATGIRDFEDNFAFDQWVLAPENSSKFWSYPYDAMSFAASPQNKGNGSALYCNPGSCSAYSSTGFEVAGLVLAATLNPSGAWYDFDLGTAVFPDRAEYPSMKFPPSGQSKSAKLSDTLTVPGQSVASTWPKTTIYDQNPSILGWTCGNLVASPTDVAKFFYELLDETAEHDGAKQLLTDASRTEMVNFQTLTAGWNAGRLKYGAGLMDLQYGHTHHLPVQGHEGDTYGFLSAQGYVPYLKGAFSIASNIDDNHPMETMACYLLEAVLVNITGSQSGLGCTLLDPEIPAVPIIV